MKTHARQSILMKLGRLAAVLSVGALGALWTGAEEIKRDNGPAVAAAEKAAAPAVAKKNSCSECCPDRCYSGEVESKTAVLTTGTHIPEKAKANDQITDSARNVRVIDRKAVERTGAANLTEALRVLTR